MELSYKELSYRGIGYQYTPAEVEVSPGKVGGRYRGLDWRFRHLRKPLVLPTNLNMLYRGTTYRPEAPATSAFTQGDQQVVAESNSGATHPLHELARKLMMSHQRAIRIRQQSMLARGVEHIGLQTNVRRFWNRIQGKVHPTFRLNYDRSHVSMS